MQVQFDDAEIVQAEDLTAIGSSAQVAADNIYQDISGYPAHWAAFTVAQKSLQEITVSKGRYLEGRLSFETADTTDINLQIHIPIAASDERWIAIILRGQVVTVSEDRDFETSNDIETSVPVLRNTPKRIERQINMVVQTGNAAPPPTTKPNIAETDAVIAFVRLNAQGIAEIEPGEKWRAKSLYEVEARVTILEIDLASLFNQAASLETDIVNVSSRLSDIPRPEIIRQMQRDLGAARLQISLPDDYRAYRFDPGLLPAQWDAAHGDWLARIMEGVRFAYASSHQALLSVFNEDDPRIIIKDQRLVPAYDEVTRIANVGTAGTRNLSQLQHTVIETKERSVTRERTIYGPTKYVCPNSASWPNYATLHAGQTFFRSGEEFEWITGEPVYNLPGGHGHPHYGYRQINRQKYEETYWDETEKTIGINGSVYGQTFLASHPMIVTSIELNFATIGSDGDVAIFICETNETGAPILEKFLASGSMASGDLQIGWNKFDVELTLLESGKRYGFFTVTTGNHSVYTTELNAYSGGSLFVTTDGAWSQGELEADFAFKINGCRFRDVRTVVPFNAATLEGGMTTIDWIAKNWIPGGTKLEWELRPQGSGVWRPIQDVDVQDHPLVGLPPLVEMRLVMLGTEHLAPMIVLDDTATVETSRHRGDMVAITENFDFGISTTTIVTEFNVDAWIDVEHTFTPSIMVNDVVVYADATETVIDPTDPEKRRFTSTYLLGAATTSARMRPEMTASNPVEVPFITDCFVAAL